MDFNEYTMMWLIKQRHAEMAEAARRHTLVARVPPRSGRLRLALGTTLIRMGAWLLRRQYATG
ncbi:MAG TPA: hypothetical protein VIE37_19020 [Methylomirabilota bacterium]|jgi:hypothetical protein